MTYLKFEKSINSSTLYAVTPFGAAVITSSEYISLETKQYIRVYELSSPWCPEFKAFSNVEEAIKFANKDFDDRLQLCLNSN